MPPSAGDLANELRINLDTLKWCLEMTAHIHLAGSIDQLEDRTLLSYPEIDAVRAEFGDLTGSKIEAQFADRQGRVDEAQDELSRLISTYEAAIRCGVAESTIRGWVRRKKLTPVEYRKDYREALCRPKNRKLRKPSSVVRESSILTSEPHRPQLPHSSKGRNWDARCDVWPALAPFTIDPAKAWYHSVPSTACLRGGSCLATAMPGPAVSRRRAG
jgi:hypothetical protein